MKRISSIILMIIIVGIHLTIFILELIPRVLYPVYIMPNYINLFLLIEAIIAVVYVFIKKEKYFSFVLIHLLFLLPAIMIAKMELACSESRTIDGKNYMKFDDEEIIQDISFYFPQVKNDTTVSKYSYYYETVDIIVYSGINIEIVLELECEEEEYYKTKEDIQKKFEMQIKKFTYNENYGEIVFVDSIDYDVQVLRKGHIKRILFNDKEHSISYIYLQIEDKIDKTELFYFQTFIQDGRSKNN